MRGEELIFDCGKKTIQLFCLFFLNSTDVLKEEEEEERQ